MLYLCLPVGSFHGWGVFGKSVTRELARMTNVRLITNQLSLDNLADLYDFKSLQETAVSANEIHAIREKGEALPYPMLHGISNKEMQPMDATMRGNYNIGQCFFEENFLRPEYIENARKNFDVVVTGCTWCEDILRDYGLDSVKTILQGIDPQIFNPVDSDKHYFLDKFVIFSGGKFEFRKGQDLVLKAFKILNEKYKDMLLVNAWHNSWPSSLNTMKMSRHIQYEPFTNDYYASVKKLLVINGINPDNVITLPKYPNAMMARIYKNTDIGLFTNRCEGGTNLVMMEYMACGKPVIGAYNSGQKDVLSAENSVMLTQMDKAKISNGHEILAEWDSPNLDEVVSKLEWAYHNREALSPLAKQAAIDMSRYTWEATAKGFYELFLPVLNKQTANIS